MKLVRKIALLLLIAMGLTFILASCAEQTNDYHKDWELSDKGGRESTPDDLPDDLDYNGYKTQIFYRKGEYLQYYECEGLAGDQTNTNTVYSTVWERNQKVENRLNCKLNWVESMSGGLAETKSEVNQILMRSDFYDFILTTNNTSLMLGKNASLCEVSATNYINLDQPWWWTKNVMDEMSYDGTEMHFLVGDINIVNFHKMSAFYFNSDLVRTYLQLEPEDLYNLVDQKKWTLEKLRSYCNIWIDTAVNPNGANEPDQGDIFSMVWVSTGETINQFVFSTKILNQLYKRKANGLVEINLASNDTCIDLIESLQKLIHNTRGTWMKTSGFDSESIQEFADGNYIFLPQRLTAAVSDALRNMESDFGIIPYPTLEEGDDYISYIQESSTSICIPIVVQFEGEDVFDRSCAIIEALNAESYRYTTVAFYEMALKNKYTRDDNAARMIDLIHDTASKSFLCEYNQNANNICSVFNAAISNNTPPTKLFVSVEPAAQTVINEFIVKTRKGT